MFYFQIAFAHRGHCSVCLCLLKKQGILGYDGIKGLKSGEFGEEPTDQLCFKTVIVILFLK
jgi:hypothetical protein